MLVMSTPAAVQPPTPENVHLYRAAVLAWRKAVCGRPVVGKDFLKLLHSAGRCGHVFDL
jgi:hypothetical protein